MTGIAPQDDPMLRLQYYQDTGQTEEAKSYERYLRETGQYHPMPTKGAGSSGEWGKEATVPQGRAADVTRSALLGASFGTLAKPIAAVDALTSMLPEWLRAKDTPVPAASKSFGDRYREFLNAGRTAQRTYEQAHPVENAAVQLGAGAVPFLLSGGAAAPAEIGEVGNIARIGKAAATGGTLGGVSGYLNTDRGWGVDALKDAAVQAGEGAIAGGLLGGVAAPVGGWLGAKIGGLGADIAGRAAEAVNAPRLAARIAAMRRPITALGPTGKAASEITAARLADQAAGSPGIESPAVPGLNVYRGGRNLTQLGGDVIRQMGGGARLRTAVQQAEDELPGLLTGELTRATGVGPNEASTTALADAITAKKTELDQVYQAARDATKGQPITSPALEQVLRTDSGRQAFNWAKEQRAIFSNNEPLPTVTETIETPRPMPKIFSTEASWQKFVEQHPEMGVERQTVTRDVPDAQLLDLMRQHLQDLARLGQTDVQGGKVATEAMANLRLWRDVHNEMPPAFQKATARAAEINHDIDALMAGQDILRTPLIPSNETAKGRVASSLAGVQERFGGAPAFQQGAGQAAQLRLRQLAANRNNPASAFSRSAEENLQMQNAMRSPDAGVRWNAALDAMNQAAERNQDLLRGSQTAERTAVREQRGGGPSLLDLATSRGKALAKTAHGAMQAQFRKNVNTSIADILASRNAGQLSDAEAMAQIRANLLRNLTTGGATAGAQFAERLNPRMTIAPDSTTTP